MTAQQGMPEVIQNVCAGSLFCQHTCLQCLIQYIEYGILIGSNSPRLLKLHRTNDRILEGTAKDSRIPQQQPARVAKPADTVIEGCSNGFWKCRRGCAGQLFGEEGVASSLDLNVLHYPLRQVRYMRDEGADLLAGKRLDIKRHHRVFPQHFFNQAAEWIRCLRRYFFFATGSNEHNRVVMYAASKVSKQLATTTIGPLQVV